MIQIFQRSWNRLHGCFLRHGWSHWTKQSKSSSFHKEMRNQLFFFCNIFVIRKNDFNRLLKVCRIWTFSFSNLCKSHCLFTEYRHFNQFCVWKNEGFWWNFLVQTQQFVHLFFKDIKFILIFWTQFRSTNQGFSQGNIVANVLWVNHT